MCRLHLKTGQRGKSKEQRHSELGRGAGREIERMASNRREMTQDKV
jgi:hypothetical protein